MTDHEPLDPDLLATYEVPPPSPDLTDRFVGRLGVPERPSRWRYVASGAALAAAAAVIALAIGTRPGDATSTGAANPTARSTEHLGTRGVAVVEAGAAIRWDVTEHAAHVRQDRGEVFYRVERATDVFEVAAGQAVVRVRGTCFRVVIDSLGTTVTVDEGKVELANARGQIIVAAGERALAGDGAPRLVSGPTLAAPPVAGASPAELLARDRAQRERIAQLEARIETEQHAVEAIGPVEQVRRVFDMNHDELVELANHCMVPHDIEPIAGSTLMDSILDRGARIVKLTDEEHAAIDRLVEQTQPAFVEQLRKFYSELTGEPGTALDPMALILEITSKTAGADTSAAFKRISAERVAGAVQATADPKSSVIERYVRFAIQSADAFEAQLAAQIGRDRARAFRRTWAMVNLAPGCPD